MSCKAISSMERGRNWHSSARGANDTKAPWRKYNPRGPPCYVSLRSKSSAINNMLECLYVRKAVLFRGWRHQCWFLGELKKCWGVLNESGPSLGYFPDAKKCWLIVKPEKEEAERDLFGQTSINISTQGQKRLGAVLGSRSYLGEYVSEQVDDWVGQVVKLAEFAATQPQAWNAACTFGLKHKWMYYLIRTLSDIEELLEPLERAISDVQIPSITGHTCTTSERELLTLPLRKWGLGLENPV